MIIAGYRIAARVAREALEKIAFDTAEKQETLRENLLNVARTTLSSKLLTHEKDQFANLAVDAILRLKGKPNLDYIQVHPILGLMSNKCGTTIGFLFLFSWSR